MRNRLRLFYAAAAIGIIIFSISLFSASGVSAAKAKKAEEPKKAEVKKAGDQKKLYAEMTDAEKKQLMDEAKAALNSMAWDITLRIPDNEKAAEEKDKLTFVDNTVISDKMKAEGFGASNYTIRLKGQMGEIMIWETMQTSEKNGIAFWRGEIRADSMRGVLSWHVDENKKIDYAFNSTAKGAPAAPPVVEEMPAVEAQPVEPAAAEPAEVQTDIIEEIEEMEIEEVPSAIEEPKAKEPEPTPAPKQEKKKGWWGR